METLLNAKEREVIQGKVTCPILQLFFKVTNRDPQVTIDECENCKNFAGLENGCVLCKYIWL